MVNRIIKSLFAVMLLSVPVMAQDDLLDMIEEGEEETTQYTSATFKATRVINTQSIETPAEGVLQFVIQHRFGTLNQGAYELWGLDQSTIRLGFDYGITDWLSVGVGRSSFQKTYDGGVKVKILRQSTGKVNMPITVAYFAGMYVNSLRWADPDRENYFSSRLSYAHQLLIARKFGDRLSIQLTPTLIHRNLVETVARGNDDYGLGFAGRFKITKRLSVNWDYVHLVKNESMQDLTNSLSLGLDIETGGHVFQLHVTNSQGMFERAFVSETTGNWLDGDIYFGFNISRVFTLKKT